MKGNKKYIVISAAIGAGVLLLGAVLIIGFAVRRNSAADGRVTRSEWLAMLGERFGIEDWGFMDETDRTDGEKSATGEFLVLTAMQTIGKYKIQLYLEMDEEPGRSDYLHVAYANDLITEDRLNAVFDREECLAFLDAVQALNDLVLWKDDFVQYTCQEKVVELKAGNVIGYQEETGEVWVDTSAVEGLSVGDVILFEMGNTGLKTAGRIESMDASSGLVTVSTPAMEEVFDLLIISDIVSFSGEDIANHYHWGNEYFGTYEDALSSTGSRGDYKGLSMGTASGSVQNEGMAFSVASEEDKITITVTNNNTGNSWKTEIPADLKDDAQIECSFEITNIDVAAQAIWRWSTLEYAEIRLYTEIVEKVNLNIVSEEIKIPLGEIPIPIAYGLASVNLQLSLVISAEGGISIETRTPVGTHLCYEKERGVRRVPMELNYSEPKIEASVEVGIALHPEATLKILVLWDAVDIGLDVGVTAGASASIHPTQTCTEIFIAFPVVSLKVTVDPIVIAPLSAEWDIIAKEDAPFQWNKHYEVYRDGTSDFVEACTYVPFGSLFQNPEESAPPYADSEESAPLQDGQEKTEFAKYSTYDLPITLWINSPFVDAGDYYTVTGRLVINYTVDAAEFDALPVGENFTMQDKPFMKGDAMSGEMFYDYPSDQSVEIWHIYEVTEDNQGRVYYFVSRPVFHDGSRDNSPYYTLLNDIPGLDGSGPGVENWWKVQNDLGEYEFRIAKDAAITAMSTPEDVHTAQECFENPIGIGYGAYIDLPRLTYTGDLEFLGEIDTIDCYIRFDADGMIDSLIIRDVG